MSLVTREIMVSMASTMMAKCFGTRSKIIPNYGDGKVSCVNVEPLLPPVPVRPMMPI